MNRKALLCILITYSITTLHCVFDIIQTFEHDRHHYTVQYILLQGAFLIAVSLFIETVIFSLILVFKIRLYWKLFVPIILITGIICGHYIYNRYKSAPGNKVNTSGISI